MPDPQQMGALADQGIDWTRYNQPFGRLNDPNPVLYPTPGGGIRQADLDRAMDIGMGFSGGGLATKAVKAPRMGETLAPDVAAPAIVAKPDVSAAVPYVGEGAVRVANPGIYDRPDVIAKKAADMVAPEHPALQQLFGVTRQDLYDIGQQGRRPGNIETKLWAPGKPQPTNPGAAAIMNPANAQRVLDALTEAEKYPQLSRGMDAWYVMDPMYQRMAQLMGPEEAKLAYRRFNATVSPFSAASDVLTEINRGTAAHMMAQQGRWPEFLKYGGGPHPDRPPELAAVKGHAYHSTAQAPPVSNYLETGQHGYAKDTVKIPLYIDASGVPQTGFQTRLPVPDAHFTRALGLPDVRTSQDFNKFMGGTEYREVGPWFREQIAKPLGIEAVPAQARMWGTFSPQTGVDTPIGAPKLELFSQRIWERAKQLGVPPEVLRDQVLRGQQHAMLDPSQVMGGLATRDNIG